MKVKQRLISFDLLKLFAIFLVLWGHCIQYLLHDNPFDNPVFMSIYAFHMPLFMMMSGFFARKTLSNKKPLEIIKNKFLELVLPCISVGAILLGGYFIKTCCIDASAISSLYETFNAVIVKDLWFLKSLFCCFLLATLAYSGKKHLYVKLGLTVLLSFFLNFYMLKRMYLFFVAGILLNANIELFKKHARMIFLGSLAGFLLLLSTYDKTIYLTQIGDVKDAVMAADGNMIIHTIGSFFHNITTGLLGCTTFISLFYTLDQLFSASGLSRLAKMGQYTLGIYILQYVILERNLAPLIHCEDSALFNFLIAPLLSVILVVGCYLLTRLIEQKRAAAFFILGKHK